RISQLAALVNGTGRFRCDVTGDSAGKRKLLEQLPHALFVLLDVGVKLGVRPFEVSVGYQAGTAMSGTGDVDHVQAVALDQAVYVNINKIQARCRAPMSQ